VAKAGRRECLHQDILHHYGHCGQSQGGAPWGRWFKCGMHLCIVD
jgi:hypothetical protein